MVEVPRISGKQMLKYLHSKGFVIKRIRGSHHFLQNEERRTCVPVHANISLKIGTLCGILRDCAIDPKDFSQEQTSRK